MLTKGYKDKTPLHSLCTNSSLTPELLAAALEGLPSETILTKDGDGFTPLHWLCEHNTSLTPELLTAALEDLPPETMLSKEWGDRTLVDLLCANISVTPELLAAALESLPPEAMLERISRTSDLSDAYAVARQIQNRLADIGSPAVTCSNSGIVTIPVFSINRNSRACFIE